MELWIRSQDEETLLKVDYLYIPISRDKEHFGIYTKNGVRDEYLGIYKSKERALEVLDEIQKTMALTLDCIINQTDNCVVGCNTLVIYEMPKE